MDQDLPTIKLFAVGDTDSSKQSVMLSYTMDKFPVDYVPTVFENYTSQVQVDSKMVNLSLWDTASQESYCRLRTLRYGQADIFLIIFSVVDISSFENALQRWYPELMREDELKGVPKIFVGNNIDMRNDNDPNHIGFEAASQIVGNLNCKYFECSHHTLEGLKQIFEEAARLGLKNKSLKNGGLEYKPMTRKKSRKNQVVMYFDKIYYINIKNKLNGEKKS